MDIVTSIVDRPITRTTPEIESSRREITAALFERLEHAHDEHERSALRQSIVCVNMPMARTVVRRFERRGELAEDLHQVAFLGLSLAVSRFRPAEGKDFLTFAVPTITGEVRRHFRDHCWAVRPPRRIQQLQARIAVARADETQRLGSEPGPADLARVLEVEVADVMEALAATGCFTPSSLDVPTSDGSTAGAHLPGDAGDLDAAEARTVLGPVLACLSAEERELIGLWLFHDQSQADIGRPRGMSQVQVSRAVSRALARVREEIGAVA